jgi:SM-20-related protein
MNLPERLSALIFSYLPRNEQTLVLSEAELDDDKPSLPLDSVRFCGVERVFTEPHVTALRSESRHFVIDGFLADRALSVLDTRAEAVRLLSEGRMRRAGMVTASAQLEGFDVPTATDKFIESSLRGDSLVWLNDQVLLDVPAVQSAVTAMRAALGELEHVCGFVASKTTVQLAHYGAGARYVRHLDATRQHAPGRRLTMLLYLNPAWTAADGGELRLFQRRADGDETSTDIAPVGDRLLVFQSHGVPHEVLESRAESRFSLTLWAYGNV